MKKNVWLIVALILAVSGLTFTVSCQKRVAAQSPSSPALTASQAQTSVAPVITSAPIAPSPAFMTDRIYFDYDKAILKPVSQTLLKQKADWLKSNPNVKLSIEGNCDERGTAEYNMALGERRAQAAKKFLVDLGVDAKRITTISFGKERPIVSGHNEAAWSKNRNDGFVVTY
jgi:peptidoglycan-associated lipoprotein